MLSRGVFAPAENMSVCQSLSSPSKLGEAVMKYAAFIRVQKLLCRVLSDPVCYDCAIGSLLKNVPSNVTIGFKSDVTIYVNTRHSQRKKEKD